jgi:hypothetical protein
MAGTPPNYANAQWPGADGLRVPQEAFPASIATYAETVLTQTTGTVNLTPQQAGSSLISLTPTANMTLVLPGCQAGKAIKINNRAAATFTVTVKVLANGTNVAIVPANTCQSVVQTGANQGVILVA